ncbi:MAG TPA: DMT family transporter [Acidimicrobiia bacterium]|nr:DMT family transporter [Acidimicrobiia bacterium]
MTVGVLWALVAAIGFAGLQVSNRKSNQLVDAYRTAFGLLLAVEILLLARAAISGELGILFSAPPVAVALFSVSAFFHFIGGWTLLALSQQRIGVARTGALVSAAPLVGTVLAALILDEPLTWAILIGVLLAAAGVALISLSGGTSGGTDWRRPWLALTVALIWGVSPMLIRLGLERFDHPVLGLTIGLGLSVSVYGLMLGGSGVLRKKLSGRAVRWMMVGGLAGAIAVSAQWISFDLTTIAIAITVQQLSAPLVIGLVPFLFHEPFERMNLRFFVGTAAMLAGSALVVLM